ncbi:MAG: DNA gyrase inhibitor YacG [Acidobacteria bacterium]|nr:DNA gyrase inhibitor YacG [Acidobacteriota bacterium]
MPLVTCPTCGKRIEYDGNEFRPFCTERCKLLDLGAWADEEFAIPTQETALSEQDVEQIERALEERGKELRIS